MELMWNLRREKLEGDAEACSEIEVHKRKEMMNLEVGEYELGGM